MMLYMPSSKVCSYSYCQDIDGNQIVSKSSVGDSTLVSPIGIFACPATVPRAVMIKSEQKHYAINCYTSGSSSYPVHLGFASVTYADSKITHIRKPSHRGAMMDQDDPDGIYPQCSKQSNVVDVDNGGSCRHLSSSGMNTCFADGHVKGMRYEEYPSTYATSSRSEGYFWDSTAE